MIKRPTKRGKWVIGTTVTILASVILTVVKYWPNKSPYTTTPSIIKSNNSGSANQTITVDQSKTVNKNNGDVVGRDKVTNNYLVPDKDKNINKSTTKKQIQPPTINNGNINSGTVNGNLEQKVYVNTPPEPRTLNDEILKGILSKVPSKDFTLEIRYQYQNAESEILVSQIISKLNNLGYQTTVSGYGSNPFTEMNRDKIITQQIEGTKTVKVTIYPQRLIK